MKRRMSIKPAAMVLAAAAVATVAAASLGGATLALWHDEQSFTSQVKTGKVAFGVGAPATTLAQNATSSASSLNFTVGQAAAQTLLDNLGVAIPIQVDSLAQGNKGLRYTVVPPVFASGSIFAAADTRLVKVSSAAECSLSPRPQLPSPVPAGYYSPTAVPSVYSSTIDPTTHFWCLTAVLDKKPGSGTYTNKVSATGQPPTGAAVTGSDQWWANVTSVSSAAAEPNHTIAFTFETFRPGQ